MLPNAGWYLPDSKRLNIPLLKKSTRIATKKNLGFQGKQALTGKIYSDTKNKNLRSTSKLKSMITLKFFSKKWSRKWNLLFSPRPPSKQFMEWLNLSWWQEWLRNGNKSSGKCITTLLSKTNKFYKDKHSWESHREKPFDNILVIF